MTEFRNQVYATDKDIFDLLVSTKRKITENVLRDIARERGIFYSPDDTREQLVDRLSLLPYGFHDLIEMMDRREYTRRGEKKTTITLEASITLEDLKVAVQGYTEDVGSTEHVISNAIGPDELLVNVEYDDIDYSRTRLIQKQRHDSSLEFSILDGKTTIRFPANDKSRQIVSGIKTKLEGLKKAAVPEEKIELGSQFNAEARTRFFTKLISEMEGYRLAGVTNLRVSPRQDDDGEADGIDLEDDERDNASREMLAVVHSMAINGENLVASPQYQQLRRQGFFITSITWKAEQKHVPNDIIKFHAEFEDGLEGKGFKYSVNGAYRFHSGGHTKTPRPVEDYEKRCLFDLLEVTARRVLVELNDELEAAKTSLIE